MQLLGLRVVKHMQNHLAANDMHGAAAVFENEMTERQKDTVNQRTGARVEEEC